VCFARAGNSIFVVFGHVFAHLNILDGIAKRVQKNLEIV
jgi:hypothetical protein